MDGQKKKISDHIENLSESYTLNVNELELIKYLISEYEISSLRTEEIPFIVESREITENFPGHFGTIRRQIPVIDVALNFTGDRALFQLRPNQYSICFPSGEVTKLDVRATFRLSANSPESIKKEIDNWAGRIKEFIGYQHAQISEWNHGLEGFITTRFRAKKDRHLAKNNLVASIGLPLLRRGDPHGTYSVPITRKPLAPPVRPLANTGNFIAHPAMDEADYQEVLDHLRHMSQTVERDPAAFGSMDEETLRTHFLLHLNGTYQGAATGETFSVSGKTDIYVQTKERAIFIAECKFWNGAASFHTIIDQLTSYLTWRDGKTAVLLFIKNEDITNVLDQIPRLVSTHRLFTKSEQTSKPGEFRFVLRNAKDESLPLILTIMCFHLPKTTHRRGQTKNSKAA